MTKLRLRRAAVILATAAIAAAGCGSSSKSKTTAATTAPPTGATGSATPAGGFAAELNTLCQQGNAKSQGVTSPQQLAAIAESYLPKLQALTPPAAEKATYDRYLASVKAEIAAANKNDIATLRKLVVESHTLGRELGAPAC